MNFHRPSPVADSSSTSRVKSESAGRSSTTTMQRSVVSARHGQSDQQHFQRLMDELRHGETPADNSEESDVASALGQSFAEESLLQDGEAALSAEAWEDASALLDDELAPSSSIFDDESVCNDEGASTDARQSASAAVLSDGSMPSENPAEVSAKRETGFVGAVPLSEAAAKIIEEMQTRTRRGDTRRWQISLPGLLGSEVMVTIECAEDQSWNVELSTADECSDEDRLALQNRIAERMDNVSVNLVDS